MDDEKFCSITYTSNKIPSSCGDVAVKEIDEWEVEKIGQYYDATHHSGMYLNQVADESPAYLCEWHKVFFLEIGIIEP